MKRIMPAVALAFAVFLTACTNIKPLMHSYAKNYDVGEPSVAYIGDPILKVKDLYSFSDAENSTCTEYQAVASENFQFIGSITNLPFFRGNISLQGLKGSKYSVTAKKTVDGVIYDLVDVVDSNGNKYSILINSVGEILPGKIYKDNHDNLISSSEAVLTPSTVRLIKGTKQYPCKVDENERDVISCHVNYELIYGGINNVTLSATYKEYSVNDLARPAFFQNLVFETAAKEIRYKNTRIEILKADNQKLEYRVTEDGLKSEVVSQDNPDYYRCYNEHLSLGYRR